MARNYNEPVITGAVNNLFALTQVGAEARLPFPVCVNLNPPGISCNGNQIVGPIYKPCQGPNTPGGQDTGDLYAITNAVGAPYPAGPVSLPWAYVSLYGRIWPGEPQITRVAAPAGGSFTVGPAYLPDGLNA